MSKLLYVNMDPCTDQQALSFYQTQYNLMRKDDYKWLTLGKSEEKLQEDVSNFCTAVKQMTSKFQDLSQAQEIQH